VRRRASTPLRTRAWTVVGAGGLGRLRVLDRHLISLPQLLVPGLARLLLSERSVDTRIDENLIENLLMEMAQTERSSTLHPRREAERLGTGATPAIAFLAVADHADRVLPELERLAGPKNGALGSYHGTLAGLHHRIDYALLTHAVSARGGRSEVAEFLARWFDGRQPLVASCQRAVTWFAAHPDTAIERAG
jgi:hypothetical protein